MELKHETWYWVTHPHEGDIFHPVYILDDNLALLDNKRKVS